MLIATSCLRGNGLSVRAHIKRSGAEAVLVARFALPNKRPRRRGAVACRKRSRGLTKPLAASLAGRKTSKVKWRSMARVPGLLLELELSVPRGASSRIVVTPTESPGHGAGAFRLLSDNQTTCTRSLYASQFEPLPAWGTYPSS
jgi:hypothetical protein